MKKYPITTDFRETETPLDKINKGEPVDGATELASGVGSLELPTPENLAHRLTVLEAKNAKLYNIVLRLLLGQPVEKTELEG